MEEDGLDCEGRGAAGTARAEGGMEPPPCMLGREAVMARPGDWGDALPFGVALACRRYMPPIIMMTTKATDKPKINMLSAATVFSTLPVCSSLTC